MFTYGNAMMSKGEPPPPGLEMNITTIAASESFTLSCRDNGTYQATIDWGDGNETTVSTFDDAGFTHVYATAGTYTIKVTGQLGEIYFNNTGTSKDRVNTVVVRDCNWKDWQNSFWGCSNLTSADMSEHNTNETPNDFRRTFRDCTSLTTVDMSGVDMSGATSSYQIFNSCSSLTYADISSFNNMPLNTDPRNLFSGCFSLQPSGMIGYKDIDVSGATKLDFMFSQTPGTAYDFSNWTTTSALTNMRYFLSNADNLDSCKFGSGWNTTNVISFYRMFFSLDNADGFTVPMDGIENFDFTNALDSGAGVGLDDFMDARGHLKVAQYDHILTNAAAATPNPTTGVLADLNDSKYGHGAAKAHRFLESDYSWVIVDSGKLYGQQGTANAAPAGSGNITFSGMALGTVPSLNHFGTTTRLCIAAITASDTSNNGLNITAVTIGGQTATLIKSAQTGTQGAHVSCIAYTSAPTGATGDVVVTISQDADRIDVVTYAIYDPVSTTPYGSDTFASTSGADPYTLTLNVPESGYLISATATHAGTATGYSGTAGVTGTPSYSFDGTLTDHSIKEADGLDSANSATVVVDFAASNQGSSVVAAWK